MKKTDKKQKETKSKKGLLIISCVFSALIITAGVFLFFLYNDVNELKANNNLLETKLAEQMQLTDKSNSSTEETQAELDEYKSLYETQLNEYSLQQQILNEIQQSLDRKTTAESSEGQTFREEDMFSKIVYLTFDDGPSANTTRILNILDKEGVKATFFVNYNSYADQNNLYQEIVDRGHSIGNHTYDHVLATSNWDAFEESFFKMDNYLYEILGFRPKIFRFPGGSKSSWETSETNRERAIEFLNYGYVFFDWNVSNNDSDSDVAPMTGEQMSEYVINLSKGRDQIILLMHDRSNKYATVESLSDIIDYYKGRDYVFLPITEESFKVQFFNPDRVSEE